MTADDQRIGRNIRTARVWRENSQAEIANAMRRAGHAWSQATVWAVETGRRPLRLTEAVDLAEALQTPLDTLAIGDLG